MSSGGQILGGVVGAAAGFLIGGPTGALYGAQLGLMAGGYLDPPKGPTINGPRLDDLTVQTSTYGAVIPRAYGTVTVTGNVFWLEGNQLKETITKKKSGGKGGGGKTTTKTYTYSATFAVGLCKGPIAGVRRIWIGPDLFYDAGSNDPDTIVASNAASSTFRVHLGTDIQLADPRIQGDLGVDNTPAWRGLAYLVFDDLQLARYGNSLIGAQIKAEVMTLGASFDWPFVGTTLPSSQQWQKPVYDGTVFCSVAFGAHAVIVSDDGAHWTQYSIPNGGATGYQGCATDGLGTLLAYGVGPVWRSTDHGQTWTTPATYYSGYTTQIEWCPEDGYFLATTDGGNFFRSTTGESWTSQSPPAGAGNYGRSLVWNGDVWAVVPGFGTNTRIYTSPTGLTGSWTLRLTMASGYANFSRSNARNGLIIVNGNGPGGPKNFLSNDGITWEEHAAPTLFNSLASESRVFIGVDSANGYYVSPDGLTWTFHSLLVIGSGWQIGAGQGVFVAPRIGATGVLIYPYFVSTLMPSLANVVAAECLQSGLLTEDDLDVSSLTASVRGYRIGSIGAIRSSIEQLQASWPFDVVQHGYVIKFVARGGVSVATIPASDLDAREAGQPPGVQVTVSREMDSQLPRRVTVQHLDNDREYNTGTQYAERLNTDAIHTRVLDLPIVLTATEAAGKAEVLLYLYWLERYDVAFKLPPTYLHLEPGDVVTLATPEGNVTLRLTGVTYASTGRVECKAKYANAALYTPAAVGVSPSTSVSGTTTITPVGESVYVLLDVPLISRAQSGPSFLAAMTGALAGWRGGVLMQSTDAGSTWSSLQEFGPPGATMGACTNSIGVVESRLIDSASVLNVTLTQGDLESVTQLAMLGGANHFAYGADGRWEIIAAQTCTLVSGTSYVLQNLLRGRCGTEWAMGMHAVGDALVLLESSEVAAIATSSGAIGLSYLYRGITVDQDISTDSNLVFTYRGVNLKPLSPIALTGNRDPSSNDWTLNWIRRTRTGGEWRDYVDADLGETSEAYQIDIYADGSYSTNKRTLSVGSPSCTYSSADQVADFGANQTTLYLKIYQISSIIGRGYPLTQSLTR